MVIKKKIQALSDEGFWLQLSQAGLQTAALAMETLNSCLLLKAAVLCGHRQLPLPEL